MKNIKINILIIILLSFFSCNKDNKNKDIFKKQFLKDWKLISSLKIPEKDKEISTPQFKDEKWLNVEVPTTVLRALVNANIYPDPHFDLNNFLIPDASDSLNKRLNLEKYSHIKNHPNPFKNPYWFRTEFNIEKENTNNNIWLNFDGINYRADVWINGKQLTNAKNMVGMFKRYKFNITDYVNKDKKNILAVKIYQVDNIGTPYPGAQLEVFGPQRGWGTEIFKDATLKFSAGWDCAPVVRDRNMGIYQDVFLTFTNDVDITNPYIITKLNLPDTTKADLTISAELINTSNKPVKGKIKGTIDFVKEVDFYSYKKKMKGNFKTITFEKQVEIPANKTITVSVDYNDFPQLSIKNPLLWWPNGYGNQNLHKLKLEFIKNKKISDISETTFGIRELTNTLKEIDGEFGRIFWVNGKKIFARGGWLQPDMMLNMNPKRMYNEARLLANANVVMIANEDMPSPPEYVMETYDKYGLMMWETFFQCWTSYPGTASFANPKDADLAISNADDIIKRYRNHPSLSLWTLQCETIVREEIYNPVKKLLKQNHPTGEFVPTSSYDWDVDKLTPYMKEDLPLGITDDGAPDYTWYPHKYYYDMVLSVKQQMFRDELGVPSVPTYTSMKKFINDIEKSEKTDIYPLNKKWAHHGAWDDDGYVYRAYDVALRSRYGKPKTAQEYIKNAQYINAASYRAMYEAANHRMWDITSGVMLWKLNSTWPTVVWQLYDWYLNPTSAYYFAKKAMEPLHIQLNENNFKVSVINATYKQYKNLKVSVKVYDFNLNVISEKEENLNIEENKYTEVFSVKKPQNIKSTYFVKLILKDDKNNILSDNFYWFAPESNKLDKKVYAALKRARLDSKELSKRVDFTDLANLENVNLVIKSTLKDEENEIMATVIVKNTSKKLAFMKRLMITKGKNGEEVLPTFWSDNFLILLPGEEKTITAKFSKEDLEGKQPFIVQDKYQ